MIIIIYILIGATTGFLSGLIGIGGGIILVPCLLATFHYLHFSTSHLMQVVVATSFAVIMITSFRSYCSHLIHKLSYQTIFLQLLPGIILGSLSGSLLAHFMHSHFLKLMFGFLMLINGMLLLLPKFMCAYKVLPSRISINITSYVIGVLCGMLGIGGSVFILPYLNYYRVNMHIAILVSISISIVIASISVITYMITGLHASGLPHQAIGYVYWPAWLAIIVGSIICAPIGARLSHHISSTGLRHLFSIFLLLDGLHILIL